MISVRLHRPLPRSQWSQLYHEASFRADNTRGTGEETLQPDRVADQRAVPVQLGPGLRPRRWRQGLRQRAAGHPDLAQRGLEPDLANDPADRLAERHRRAVRRPVRPRRHHAEPVLLARQAGRGGIIWGVGPVFLLPTATDDLLGGGKWGAGPTGRRAEAERPVDHRHARQPHLVICRRRAIAAMSTPPSCSRSSPTRPRMPGPSRSTRKAPTTGKPTSGRFRSIFRVSKLVVDKQPISLFAGVRYWAASPDSGPEGFGVRAGVTLLFPK